MTRKRATIAKHGRLLRVGPLTYGEVARAQRAHARSAADAMERGEPFDAPETLAAMIRTRAAQPWRGRPPAGTGPDRTPEREAMRRAADALERGEPFDVSLAAKALRAWAATLRATPKRLRGKPPKHDHAAIALAFEAQHRRDPGKSAESIKTDLMGLFDVSDRATIDEARIACGDAARRHFDATLGPSKK